MASFAMACRLSARLATRSLSRDATIRGFRTTAAALAAQNFTMPALSPTMTEGNIASWRVKEGEKFSAGDVLLEIETDKATMDVEAQDDGVLVKIMKGDGSKSVQVGTRIAVIAEEGDDVSSLEIPPDEGPKPQAQKEASTAPETPAPAEEPKAAGQSPATTSAPRGKPVKQTYPLLPSVAHLLKENGLDESAVDQMTPTGPNGRLLKGDVLVYLGKVKANVPADIEARFEEQSHLDLSNIKVAKPSQAAPAAAEKPSSAAPEATPAAEPDAVVTLPVSLEAAVRIQKKVEESLGTFLPLSTFITRAAELANEDLPLPAGAQPSVDELFDQVLGLDKVGGRKTSRGAFLPQVAALVPSSFAESRPSRSTSTDIIDILAGSSSGPAPRRKPETRQQLVPGLSGGLNVFSLSVPKQEEKRARVFLERVKLVLEKDPGRLVL
ncbi:hypothetical protein VTK73DRAFT_1775 [Phialemonium thermophilum]|uniref:Uncharacterized protein n=1 Tax=Phialemonium thermophilum TaxID=223376 RepID=A0ABR3X7R6_9PEZI